MSPARPQLQLRGKEAEQANAHLPIAISNWIVPNGTVNKADKKPIRDRINFDAIYFGRYYLKTVMAACRHLQLGLRFHGSQSWLWISLMPTVNYQLIS